MPADHEDISQQRMRRWWRTPLIASVSVALVLTAWTSGMVSFGSILDLNRYQGVRESINETIGQTLNQGTSFGTVAEGDCFYWSSFVQGKYASSQQPTSVSCTEPHHLELLRVVELQSDGAISPSAFQEECVRESEWALRGQLPENIRIQAFDGSSNRWEGSADSRALCFMVGESATSLLDS